MSTADKSSSAIKTITHWVDGKSFQGESQRWGTIFNPATGEQPSRVALATVGDVEHAIASAQAAFPAWSRTPVIRRARVMFKFKELVEKHMDELHAQWFSS